MKRVWLANLRASTGKMQKDVADSAGISQPAYSSIEAGTKNPTVETAKRIAAVLGFDWTMFFEEPSSGDSA